MDLWWSTLLLALAGLPKKRIYSFAAQTSPAVENAKCENRTSVNVTMQNSHGHVYYVHYSYFSNLQTCRWIFVHPDKNTRSAMILKIYHSRFICSNGYLELPDGSSFCERRWYSTSPAWCAIYVPSTSCVKHVNDCAALPTVTSSWPPTLSTHSNLSNTASVFVTYRFTDCNVTATKDDVREKQDNGTEIEEGADQSRRAICTAPVAGAVVLALLSSVLTIVLLTKVYIYRIKYNVSK